MKTQYTEQARTAIMYAEKMARKCGHSYIGTEHLLAGLIHEEQGTAGMVLRDLGITEAKLKEMIDKLIAPGSDVMTADTRGYTPRAERVLEESRQQAQDFRSVRIGTEHILLAILGELDCVATRLLHTMGIQIQKLQTELLIAMGEDSAQAREEVGRKNGKNRMNPGTPVLDQYSRDLTELARQGKLDPVVGREAEINRLIQILSRRTKNNPCLIGEPGVGKTAIAEGLAQRIVQGVVPDTVKNKRVVVLDLSGMVAGSKYRGEFEERIKRVVQEVMEHQGILLFIDELHTIIGAGWMPRIF